MHDREASCEIGAHHHHHHHHHVERTRACNIPLLPSPLPDHTQVKRGNSRISARFLRGSLPTLLRHLSTIRVRKAQGTGSRVEGHSCAGAPPAVRCRAFIGGSGEGGRWFVDREDLTTGQEKFEHKEHGLFQMKSATAATSSTQAYNILFSSLLSKAMPDLATQESCHDFVVAHCFGASLPCAFRKRNELDPDTKDLLAPAVDDEPSLMDQAQEIAGLSMEKTSQPEKERPWCMSTSTEI
ncbi:hypothetical protein FIBSPDRAFT_850916 [Athelia psychrophila]|uniref:Uncharacterized protein n=1 Tax=Athelia psychrophila TaxID=1759441 RepID=A0A166T4G3_9AGAM|nr:hypothetical protein FIBSPDRAFT_850916 [Fibularhizoctonia sp. CBS 109695]